MPEITPLGFKKPYSATELVRWGAQVIADNAQKAEELITQDRSARAALANRLGQAEANISAGMGGGPGLTEDPLNPGTYFIANDSPLTEDPVNPGFYTF